jgi:hypothetical protein
MKLQPSVIASGDFLFFAPSGKAFTIPSAGVVSNAAKPDPTDPIWTDYSLGTVDVMPVDKRSSKEVKIMRPTTTGTIVPVTVIRPQHELTMEVTMNEVSRLALTGFYKSSLIEITDTTFYPLTASSLQGWLKRQRYDDSGNPWLVDDWWVDLDVSEFTKVDPNVIKPKFMFTWLSASPSTLNAGAI